jgi:hypothetical protein
MQTASVIGVLAGLGLFLSSSCGGDAPAAVADNNTGPGGSPGAGGTAAPATGGGAGSNAQDDAAVGSGGSGQDLDATIFVDHVVDIPDGAFATGDATLDDDGGNEPPLEDAGSAPSDGGIIAKRYTIFCGARSCSGPVSSCCYDSDTGNGSCTLPETRCTQGVYQCDGPEDCATREVCCATVSTLPILLGGPNHEYFTRCATTCGSGAILRDTAYAVVCKKAADCGLAVGVSCKAVVNMPHGLGICSGGKVL